MLLTSKRTKAGGQREKEKWKFAVGCGKKAQNGVKTKLANDDATK
jgi:hypothetical protein